VPPYGRQLLGGSLLVAAAVRELNIRPYHEKLRACARHGPQLGVRVEDVRRKGDRGDEGHGRQQGVERMGGGWRGGQMNFKAAGPSLTGLLKRWVHARIRW
jgi:hypothetical protein